MNLGLDRITYFDPRKEKRCDYWSDYRDDRLNDYVDYLYNSIITTIKESVIQKAEIFLIDEKKCCKTNILSSYEFIDAFDKDKTNKFYNECKSRNAKKYKGMLIPLIIDTINKEYRGNYKIEKIYKNNNMYYILFEYLYQHYIDREIEINKNAQYFKFFKEKTIIYSKKKKKKKKYLK